MQNALFSSILIIFTYTYSMPHPMQLLNLEKARDTMKYGRDLFTEQLLNQKVSIYVLSSLLFNSRLELFCICILLDHFLEIRPFWKAQENQTEPSQAIESYLYVYFLFTAHYFKADIFIFLSDWVSKTKIIAFEILLNILLYAFILYILYILYSILCIRCDNVIFYILILITVLYLFEESRLYICLYYYIIRFCMTDSLEMPSLMKETIFLSLIQLIQVLLPNQFIMMDCFLKYLYFIIKILTISKKLNFANTNEILNIFPEHALIYYFIYNLFRKIPTLNFDILICFAIWAFTKRKKILGLVAISLSVIWILYPLPLIAIAQYIKNFRILSFGAKLLHWRIIKFLSAILYLVMMWRMHNKNEAQQPLRIATHWIAILVTLSKTCSPQRCLLLCSNANFNAKKDVPFIFPLILFLPFLPIKFYYIYYLLLYFTCISQIISSFTA